MAFIALKYSKYGSYSALMPAPYRANYDNPQPYGADVIVFRSGTSLVLALAQLSVRAVEILGSAKPFQSAYGKNEVNR